jgi:uncharacterized protein YdgA (DUF945 family)
MREKFTLATVSVGGQRFRQFVVGSSTDHDDRHSWEALAQYAKKLKARHAGHIEVGNNQMR